eukprot:406454_1
MVFLFFCMISVYMMQSPNAANISNQIGDSTNHNQNPQITIAQQNAYEPLELTANGYTMHFRRCQMDSDYKMWFDQQHQSKVEAWNNALKYRAHIFNHESLDGNCLGLCELSHLS